MPFSSSEPDGPDPEEAATDPHALKTKGAVADEPEGKVGAATDAHALDADGAVANDPEQEALAARLCLCFLEGKGVDADPVHASSPPRPQPSERTVTPSTAIMTRQQGRRAVAKGAQSAGRAFMPSDLAVSAYVSSVKKRELI